MTPNDHARVMGMIRTFTIACYAGTAAVMFLNHPWLFLLAAFIEQSLRTLLGGGHNQRP
jgi:hypothetical protein